MDRAVWLHRGAPQSHLIGSRGTTWLLDSRTHHALIARSGAPPACILILLILVSPDHTDEKARFLTCP
jgi:hypothetical protein